MRKPLISSPVIQRTPRLDRREMITAGLLGSAAFLFHQRLEAVPKMPWVETADDIEGPFYTPDAPERSVLYEDGAPGKRLDLRGQVFDTDGKPIMHALLDVWQTDDDAQYDNEGFGMRGRLYTDDRGFYRLKTLVPKPYDVGNRFRPAHIHFKVSAPDGPILTTQLYIKGDPHIAADPHARPSRMIRLKPAGRGTAGRFDFVVRQG